MKHTLVVIGKIGNRRCYLDVSRDEAVRRFCASEEVDIEDIGGYRIREFAFDDEFAAYDAYEAER